MKILIAAKAILVLVCISVIFVYVMNYTPTFQFWTGLFLILACWYQILRQVFKKGES